MKYLLGGFLAIVLLVVAGGYLISGVSPAASQPAGEASVIDGTQVVNIRAKGGYQPQESSAKAGIPTVLRISTSSTFDCSSSIRIPSMNIRTSLPPTGTTDIALRRLSLGILQGTCGMGRYPFQMKVQS